MAVGDWSAGSRLLVDNISAVYTAGSSVLTMGFIVVQWRVMFPSGTVTVPMFTSLPQPLGTTSHNIATQIGLVLAAMLTLEGLAP